MIKELTYEKKDELAEYKGKWRNIVFDTKGNSYRGMGIHNTKEEAAFKLKDSLAFCESVGSAMLSTLDGKFLYREYAWGMQIPVGDK